MSGNPRDSDASGASSRRPATDDAAERASLSAEQWSVVESVFAQALEIEPSKRGQFLDDALADAALRAEVESLLRAHDPATWFLDGPPPWSTDTVPAAETTPTPEQIGPYRILRPIGRGGMGQVYLAEREAPGFTRQVALKVMRRGLDTDDLIERFTRERQILARLDHPNIARLYDVGATEDGRPFYVMEHVQGRPLLEYCDAERLPVGSRIALFRTVCEAVQYAHANLIVHRDLKPSNILVTEDGVPKLLDFGIAKLLDQSEVGDRPDLTQAGAAPLTPGYAAPEQLRGEPVTTACDVYALGVLLYVLLVGRHPYSGTGGRTPVTAQVVLTTDPARPSRAVAGVDPGSAASDRSVTPDQLARQLRGDLDNIVLVAIRKDASDRYPSVQSFAEDLDRYGTGLPVRARPATTVYRLRKFVSRNGFMVTATAAVFLTLAAATVTTLYQSRRIREQSEQVARERDKALEVRSFLLEMFGSTGPDQAADSVTAREMLDRRRSTLTEAYGADPETHAEMMTVLADGYERLGLIEDAQPLAREALNIRRSLFGTHHPDVAVSLNILGWLRRQSGDLPGADSMLRESIEIGRAVFPAEGDARLARALNDLGVVRIDRGDADEAAVLLGESLDMRRRVLGDRHIGVAITTSNLAVVKYSRGDLEGMVQLAEAALLLFRELLGPDHQRTVIVRQNLATARSAWGDAEGAAAGLRQIVDGGIERLGERHPTVAFGKTLLADAMRRLDRLDEAESLLLEARDALTDAYPAGHPDLVNTLRVLGDVYTERGKPDQALATYRAGLDYARRVHGQDHEETAVLVGRIAVLDEAAGRLDDARRGYRDAAASAASALGSAHSSTIELRVQRLEFLVRHGDPDSARALLPDVTTALEQISTPNLLLEDRVAAVQRALAGR